MSIPRRHFAVALAATAASPLVFGQAWPSRPIRLLVGYPPGGFTDVTARLIADRLQARLGQPVVVENKPGANGIVAVDTVARSTPDGHTFAVVIAAHAANTTLYKKLPYDPRKDLVGVSLIGLSPLVLAVNKNSKIRTAKELLSYAKANPDKVSFGSSGTGSAVHLSVELLKSLTGTKMVHIPYKGSAAGLTDLLGGQLDLFGDAAQGLIGPAKAGSVHLIGVASEKRLPALPNVPTFVEQGVDGFIASTWAGVIAPAGTPSATTKRMAEEIAAIIRQDEVRSRLDDMGTVPIGSTPAEFEQFMADETAKWAKVIRGANVTLD